MCLADWDFHIMLRASDCAKTSFEGTSSICSEELSPAAEQGAPFSMITALAGGDMQSGPEAIRAFSCNETLTDVAWKSWSL